MPATSSQLLLELSADRWSLWDTRDEQAGCLRADAWSTEAPDELAAALQQHAQEQGIASLEIVIGLDAELCLSTRLELPPARRLRSRAAILFKMEETLPISAEEVTSAVVKQGSSALAVCCQREWLEQLVRALAEAGCVVRAVAPVATLAAAEHVRHKNLPTHHLALWAEDEGGDWVEIEGGRLIDWRRLPGGCEALQQELDAASLTSGRTLPVVYYGSSSLRPDYKGLTDWKEESASQELVSLHELAIRYAGRVLRGEADCVINLLQDNLAELVDRHNPLRWELFAARAALLLLLASGVLLAARLAWSSANQANLLTAQQDEVFRQTLPDKRVPAAGVRMRLASELRRLKGVRGATDETPDDIRAMQVVRDVLCSLPEEMRCRVLELRLENNRLKLSGHVRSHGDADRLAASLRNLGVPVGPPATQQLTEKGVQFQLTAAIEKAKEPGA